MPTSKGIGNMTAAGVRRLQGRIEKEIDGESRNHPQCGTPALGCACPAGGGWATGIEAFQESGAAEVVGFISCGGCPGKKAVARAMEMEKRGAEAIVMAAPSKTTRPACPRGRALA